MPISTIRYDEAKLRKALQDFYYATGISIAIMDENFAPFLETNILLNDYCTAIQRLRDGNCACQRSDSALLERCQQTKQVEIHVCHAGLIDVGVPILYDGKIIAYIILGQMRSDEDFSSVEHRILHLPLNHAQMREYYEKIPLFNSDRIESVASVAEMLAKIILLEHMLRPNKSRILERAEAFIAENLSEPLSIEHITRSIGASKSTLYREFREQHGCTVNEYIKRQRVERSLHFLLNTDLSVEEISQRVGFGSSAYFTVHFKREMGTTPVKFRNGRK